MTKTTRKSQARKMTFIILAIFILIATIGGTYSRYTSTGSGTGTAQVAKWAVEINDTDIVSNNSFNVTFQEVANDHVVDGKIAPASRLYADFVVDPAGSEVSIDYDFALSAITASTGTVPTGIDLEKVVLLGEGGTETTLTATGGKYTGSILLPTPNAALTSSDAQTVRVYIKWTNSDATADSANHTAAGVATPTLSMEVTGTAKQHIAE